MPTNRHTEGLIRVSVKQITEYTRILAYDLCMVEVSRENTKGIIPNEEDPETNSDDENKCIMEITCIRDNDYN